VSLLVDRIQLRSCVLHDANAPFDSVGDDFKQIGLRLNLFAVVLIHDMHALDHAAGVVAEYRGR
jgi:hypothetical protein